jgi:small subunit ribosomal protein S21e
MTNYNREKFSYIPRKCSYSNQILASKDHSSVQISIGILNKKGIFSGKSKIYALVGILRKKGYSDRAMNFLSENIDKN